MLNVIALIGTAILVMIILHIINYGILGKMITYEAGSDGYEYRVGARHYPKAFFFSSIEMMVLLTIFFKNSHLDLNIFKALGISLILTIVGVIVLFAIGVMFNKTDTSESKVYNTAREELSNRAYERGKFIIPTYILMTIADGILITILLHSKGIV